MNVNLNCIYGNLLPKNNPHEIEDELAEKLISQGYATKSDKSEKSKDNSDSIKKENEELGESLQKANADLNSANEKIKELEESLQKANEIIDLLKAESESKEEVKTKK